MEEEKKLYTKTEISVLLNKTLSNLSFYRNELKEQGFLVTANNKEMITKDGFNYLKLRFAGQMEKKQITKTETKKVETGESINKKEIAQKAAAATCDENMEEEKKFSEKDLEIEKLKMENETLKEKNNDLNSQVLKWEGECKAWQKNVDKTNEDKQFWQDFATRELGNLKNRLLPETTETVATPVSQKKSLFSIFRKNKN